MSPPYFCPAYPRPLSRRASLFALFRGGRRSWLDTLYERSYRMQMGEVQLPGGALYMVNDPDVIRQMLVKETASFPKSRLLSQALHPLLGDSVLTTNGEQWAGQRAMMAPAFEQTRLDVAFPAMQAAVAAMQQRMDAALGTSTHHEPDIEAEMAHVTADIIFRTIFSEPLEGAQSRRVFAAFGRFQAMAPRLLLPRLFGVRWLAWPWIAARSRRAAREIRGLLEDLIRRRHQTWLAGEQDGRNDILSVFLAARDSRTGAAFTFDELVDQVAVLFLAGHETTASALSWSFYMLAHVPDVQERLHAEAVRVFGGRTPAQADMKELALARNVFRETLRLFPPVGFMARESAQTCPMRDKTVPQGSTIVVSPWLVHRHRERWLEPDAFNPDRFDAEASRDAVRNAYLPFGMGPRVCLGAAFAMQEATLILATVVRAFRIEAVEGHVPQPVGRLTIRSGNGVYLRISRRGRTTGDAP